MGYSTSKTKTSIISSVKSKQTATYQYPNGDGVVVTGDVSTQTNTFLDVLNPGSPRTFTSVSGGSKISSIVYLDANNQTTNSVAISTLGGNVLINGTNFTSNTKVYIDDTLVTSQFVNSSAIIATVGYKGFLGNATVSVFNSANTGGALSNTYLRFSGAPVWITPSNITLLSNNSITYQLEAYSDSGPLIYTIKSGSGSLPTGLSLSSSGLITGTPTGYTTQTTVSLTMVVTDIEQQSTQKDFFITIVLGDSFFDQTILLMSSETQPNTFIRDASSYNHMLTVVGDVAPTRLSPYWKGGHSVFFPSNASYFTLPSTFTAKTGGGWAGTGNKLHTIEAWIYLNASVSTNSFRHALFSNMSGSAVNGRWSFGIIGQANYGLNRLFFGYTTSTSVEATVTASVANIPVQSWSHVAMTIDATTAASTTIRFFVNGNLIDTFTGLNFSTQTAHATPIYLGTPATGSNAWNGYISNFRYVYGDLLYTTNFTLSNKPLSPTSNTICLFFRDNNFEDSSGGNNTLTIVGSPETVRFSPFFSNTYTITSNSSSVYFDGNGDNLSIPHNTALDLSSGDFTIECWIYCNALTAGDQQILNKDGSSGVSLPAYALSITSAGVFKAELGNGNGVTGLTSYTGNVITSNTWTHVACVKTGTTIRVFQNGLQTNSSSQVSTIVNGSRPLLIGYQTGQAGSQYFNGYISNLRILKGTALYTANFTPSTTALTSIANTSLLTCQSTTVIDNSNNNFAITVNGDARMSEWNPFGEVVTTNTSYWQSEFSGGSAFFDGTGDYITVSQNNAAFAFGTGDFTVEAWVYPSVSSAGYQTIVANGDGSVANPYFNISNNTPNVYFNGGFRANGPLVKANTWNHVAFSRSGTSLRVFTNGIPGVTTTDSSTLISSGLTIGAFSNIQLLTGRLSNLRIIKGTALYTRPFIPPKEPLANVSNTTLLTLQSSIPDRTTRHVDSSGYDSIIRAVGGQPGTSSGSFSPFVPSAWSAFFSGTEWITTGASTAGSILTLTSTSTFTIECWLYPTAHTTSTIAGTVFGQMHATGGINYWSIGPYNSNGTPVFFWFDGAEKRAIGNTTIQLNTWTHYAVTANSGVLRMYINGIQQTLTGTTILTNQSGTTGNVSIGRWQSAGAGSYRGHVHGLRVVSGNVVYTQSFTPPTDTPVPIANTTLLMFTDTGTFEDQGPNRIPIATVSEGTAMLPFGPFGPQTKTPKNYSINFTGSDFISCNNANLVIGANSFTIETWVYNRVGSNNGIFQISTAPFGITNGHTETLTMSIINDKVSIRANNNTIYTSTGSTITKNTWHHLALTHSSSSNITNIFINGSKDTTVGTSGDIIDTNNYNGTTLAIGGYVSTSALFNGLISNFRYNKNDIIYTGNFVVPGEPLTSNSNTQVLIAQAGNTVLEITGKNFAVNGNPTLSGVNPFGYTREIGVSYDPAIHGGSVLIENTVTDDSLDQLTKNPTINSTYTSLGYAPFTVEAWVYLPRFGSTSYIYGGALASTIQFTIFTIAAPLSGTISGAGGPTPVATSARFPYFGYYTGTAWQGNSGNRQIDMGSWNHLAISYDGFGTVGPRIFLNGVDITVNPTQSTYSPPSMPSAVWYIGRRWDTASPAYSTIYISNLKVIRGESLYKANTSFIPTMRVTQPTPNTILQLDHSSTALTNYDTTYKNNMVTVGDAKVTTFRSKFGNQSIFFDGTGDYILSSSGIAANNIATSFGTGDFTIEFWLNSATASSQTGILIDYRPTGTQGLYPVLYINAGVITYFTNSADRIAGSTLPNNQWIHIALTRFSSSTRLFVDGIQVGATYADTNSYITGLYRPVIGSAGTSLGSSVYSGYMDDLRITHGYARYTGNFSPPVQPHFTR